MTQPKTIRLSVEVRAGANVDPEILRGDMASALDLILDGSEYDSDDIDASATVVIDETPRDEDGPFALFQQEPGGGYSDEATRGFETWAGALGKAQDYENSGVFVQLTDATGKIVYSSEG
jgi:hypothetical protein